MISWLFVLVNILFWLGIILLQQWEFRTKRIPERKKWSRTRPDESFLYLQDWYAGNFGDLLGLSCLVWAFGANRVHWSGEFLLVAFAIGLAVTILLHFFWKSVRPNSGYPVQGEISLSGRAHLLYVFIHISIALSLFFNILIGVAGTLTLIATACGVILYGVSLLWDVHGGKFSR
ncbi:MAG: hypothetical protein WAU28_05810 [Candidatus Moraniibacteriota bacterium]